MVTCKKEAQIQVDAHLIKKSMGEECVKIDIKKNNI